MIQEGTEIIRARLDLDDEIPVEWLAIISRWNLKSGKPLLLQEPFTANFVELLHCLEHGFAAGEIRQAHLTSLKDHVIELRRASRTTRAASVDDD